MVGADGTFFNSLNLVDQYLYSVYWALQTLTTSDYGNPSPMSMQQTFAAGIRSTLFLGFQTALMAYILGTTTLLLVKSDERMGRFRDRFATVRQFADSNRLPKELRERMEEHLRLYFETNDLADAQVLQVYPSTIRRQILRFLYYDTLKQAYLFNGIGRAFLDAVLAEASLEVYLPNVEILTSGEFVNELHLVVQGSVEARQPSTGHSLSTMDEGDEMAFDPDAPNFLTRTLHVGELFGETAFFTETPQLETVRSRTMCRVMVLSRSAFESMERNHPISARRVLYNLQKHAEELVAEAFPEQRKSKTFGRLLKRSPSSLQIGPDALNVSQYTFPTSSGSSSRSYSSGPSAYAENGASASNGRAGGRPYSNGNGNNGSSNGGSTNGATRNNGVDGPSWLTASMNGDVYTLAESISTGLTPEQELVLQTLLRIRAVVQSQISKLDEERTTLFLYAASQGNSSLIRKMVDEGFMVDSVDYDGRTALMLASASGHVAVVKLLLQHGADPNHQDGLGRCAILEACMHDHDAVIDVLRLSGASLQHVAEEGVMLEGKEESLRQEQVLKEVQAAARLCTAVYQCNLPLLRRLMRAGTPVNAGDYDKRTALHISAAEGNLPVVKMLVEEWEADIDVRDRWGNLPLDEANRVGATPVVDFLRSARAKRVAQAIEHIAEQL